MDSRSDTLVRTGAERAGPRSPAAGDRSGPEDMAAPLRSFDAPKTQILPARCGHLGEAGDEIGQRLGPDRLELFVAADAAQAMQEQIDHHAPEYIAVHDLGGSGGLRLLAAIGAARRTPLQQLAIRRQGHGMALATLRFVELESRGRRRLRLYSTDIDADSQTRRQLARVLMGHARLAVMLVGELPAHALDTALAPWRETLQADCWANRDLLLLPRSAASRLGEHAARLAGDSQVHVVVSAAATQPNEIWTLIAGAWNRVRSARRQAAAAVALPREAAEGPAAGTAAATCATACETAAPSAPVVRPEPAPIDDAAPLIGRIMSLGLVRELEGLAEAPRPDDVRTEDRSVPPADDRSGSVGAAPAEPRRATIPGADLPRRSLYERYLRACEPIKGLISACIFEVRGGQCLAHVGGRPGPQALTAQGMRLSATLADAGYALGLGASQPGATITLPQHHLLLHPLPGHPGVVMHAVLDGSIADPTLAQLRIRLVDGHVLGPDKIG